MHPNVAVVSMGRMLTTDVSVIIPFRGDSSTLLWTLDGFARQQLPDDIRLDVRVGGDGCPPPAYTPPVDNMAIRFSLLSLPRSGVGGTKNLLLEGVYSEVLIFANADTCPGPGFVAAHVWRLLHLPEGFMVLGNAPYEAPSIVTNFDKLKEWSPMIFFYGTLKPHECYNYRHAWNLNVSVRNSDFRRAGGFSTELRPYGYEDLDLAFKVMGQKPAVYYDPSALVVHRHPMLLDDYLNREEALGSVAPVLSRVNPKVFELLLGTSDLDKLASDYRVWTSMDIAAHRWTYQRLSDWVNEPRPDFGGKNPGDCQDATHMLMMALYQMHIPLKRLAFRLGFQRGLELMDDSRWQERGSRGLWKQAIS
jgi:hypothetical protein